MSVQEDSKEIHQVLVTILFLWEDISNWTWNAADNQHPSLPFFPFSPSTFEVMGMPSETQIFNLCLESQTQVFMLAQLVLWFNDPSFQAPNWCFLKKFIYEYCIYIIEIPSCLPQTTYIPSLCISSEIV